jgi:hypothetical protein
VIIVYLRHRQVGDRIVTDRIVILQRQQSAIHYGLAP